jgi:hypothetical protein
MPRTKEKKQKLKFQRKNAKIKLQGPHVYREAVVIYNLEFFWFLASWFLCLFSLVLGSSVLGSWKS